jgi:hypothetical protein
MFRLLLLIGAIYWFFQALPYIAGAGVAIWWCWSLLGVWVDKPIPTAPKEPEIRFLPRYPDMPQEWNWSVHLYLLDEINSFELVHRAA